MHALAGVLSADLQTLTPPARRFRGDNEKAGLAAAFGRSKQPASLSGITPKASCTVRRCRVTGPDLGPDLSRQGRGSKSAALPTPGARQIEPRTTTPAALVAEADTAAAAAVKM
jgi:hypothetical protein